MKEYKYMSKTDRNKKLQPLYRIEYPTLKYNIKVKRDNSFSKGRQYLLQFGNELTT